MDMLRFHNRVVQLRDDRLPKMIYKYDIQSKKSTWLYEVRKITSTLHLPLPEHNLLYDLDAVNSAILKYCQNEWWRELLTKPRLCFYALVKHMEDENTLARTNLVRCQRSMVSEFVCGILPLEIVVGRYTRVDHEDRHCKRARK